MPGEIVSLMSILLPKILEWFFLFMYSICLLNSHFCGRLMDAKATLTAYGMARRTERDS